jgi:hydroxymethylpyrimidine/phosphomethylpyrimidine kinase
MESFQDRLKRLPLRIIFRPQRRCQGIYMKNSNDKREYHKVLTIAGSDSCGGAGIQADLKTMSAIGCYGMSVITALTAQNTQGVRAIHAVPPAFAAEQITAVLSDIGADAVKIGMLYSAELIRVVAEQLKKFGARNIVLDPVMVAQSGDKLLQDEAIEAVRELLMPLADVVTANIPEAQVLLDREIRDLADMRAAAESLAAEGSRSILVKGGHLELSKSTDLLFIAAEKRHVVLEADRITSRNNHGTGCTLSSAIAGYLAKGCSLEEAVQKAKTYIQNAIRAGADYRIGKGHGPVHHFFAFWR